MDKFYTQQNQILLELSSCQSKTDSTIKRKQGSAMTGVIFFSYMMEVPNKQSIHLLQISFLFCLCKIFSPQYFDWYYHFKQMIAWPCWWWTSVILFCGQQPVYASHSARQNSLSLESPCCGFTAAPDPVPRSKSTSGIQTAPLISFTGWWDVSWTGKQKCLSTSAPVPCPRNFLVLGKTASKHRKLPSE